MTVIAGLLLVVGGVLLLYTVRQYLSVPDRLRRRFDETLAAFRIRGAKSAELVPVSLQRFSPWRVFVLRALAADPRRHWGTTPSLGGLAAVSVAAALLAGGIAQITFGASPSIVAPIALAASLLGPRALVRSRRRRDESRFLDLFPDAIDMVARALRAGSPITGAIRTTAIEIAKPVATVLHEIADQVAIGIPLEDALNDTSGRVRLSEFRFFAVAVSLQRTTGGNLATTLEIMGDILRRRKTMRLKAKATSAEVRVSGVILGLVPAVVGLGLVLLAPGYVSPLISDPRGHVLLGAAALFLAAGALTMKSILRRNLAM